MAYSPLVVDKSIWGFDPRIIPTCTLWLDGADSNTITISSGTAVTQWRDKSSNAALFNTVSVSPNTSTINGYRSVLIANAANGSAVTTDQSLLSATSVPYFTAPGQFAGFVVVTYTATQINNVIQDFAAASNFNMSTANQYTVTINASTTSSGQFYGSSSSSRVLLGFTYDPTIASGSRVATYYSGTAGNVAGTGTATAFTNRLRLNTPQPAIVGNQNLHYHEVLLYSASLSTSDRQQIEGYLGWKWGIQGGGTAPVISLPTTHPYRNTYSVVRPFLRTFVPTDVSRACLLWFDGADESSLTFSGSNVTGWRDKSGNANNITSFFGTAPTYSQTTNFLTFTGGSGATSTGGTTTSNISLTSNISYTIFIVARFPTLSDSGANDYIRVVQQLSPSNYFFGLARASYTPPGTSNVDYYIEGNRGNGPYYSFVSSRGHNTYANSVFIYSITQPNTRTYTLSLNGNVGTSTAPSIAITAATPVSANTRYSVNATASFNVGATVIVAGITLAGGATGYNGIGVVQSIITDASVTLNIVSSGTVSSYTGAIASSGILRTGPIVIGGASVNVPTYGVGEVLFYDGALSTQERQRVEGYLIWKWGAQRTDYPTIGGANAVPDFPTTHPMYRFPPATVAPFIPSVITGLSVWIDAADTTSFTVSGGFITQLQNKSTGTNLNPTASAFQHVQTFNTNYPAFFGANTGGGGSLGSIPSFTLSNPSTIFVVFKNTGDSSGVNTGPYLFNITGTSNTNRAFAYWNNQGSSKTKLRIKTGNTPDEVLTNVETNNTQVLSMQMGATATQTYTNGTIATTPSIIGATVANSTLTIGGNDATGALTGFLAEFIIYNAALTASQRQQVEGYLAWKWGLNASLPTTHPYYKVPT